MRRFIFGKGIKTPTSDRILSGLATLKGRGERRTPQRDRSRLTCEFKVAKPYTGYNKRSVFGQPLIIKRSVFN